MFELVAQSLVSGIAIGCVYGLIGIGFCVIYNASGIVNFAQGAFVMLGGMITYVGLTRYGLPLSRAGGVAAAQPGTRVEREPYDADREGRPRGAPPRREPVEAEIQPAEGEHRGQGGQDVRGRVEDVDGAVVEGAGRVQ